MMTEWYDDRVVRCHVDHLRAHECVDQADSNNTEIVEVLPLPVSEPENEVLEFVTNAPLRRSARISQPPSHLIEETDN